MAYERVGACLEEVGRSDDPAKDMRGLGFAFVTAAADHPGHFRLMFRNDLVNRDAPRFSEAAGKPVLANKATHFLQKFDDLRVRRKVPAQGALARLYPPRR